MEVVLGCGNFGGIGFAPAFFGRGESREEAFAIMDAAWELGLRWFDTADAYGGSRSEQWIGDWMRATGKRPRVTSKTFNAMKDGADFGLARDRVLRPGGDEPRAARRRPDRPSPRRTSRIRTRRSREPTPRSRRCSSAGPSRPGASAMSARPTSTASGSSSARRRSVQNSYSLLDRGDEAEVIPLCAERGVAYQAFSPLAGGWLTGKYRRGEEAPPARRMAMRPEPYRHLETDSVFDALEGLERGAAARGVSTAGLALAWALGGTSSVVVGPRRPEHLEPVREALALSLSAAEREEVGSAFPC